MWYSRLCVVIISRLVGVMLVAVPVLQPTSSASSFSLTHDAILKMTGSG